MSLQHFHMVHMSVILGGGGLRIISHTHFKVSRSLDGIFDFCNLFCRDFCKPVVSGGRKRSTQQKPPPYPKSLAIISHALTGI